MNKKPSEKQLQYAKQIEAATGIPIKNEGNVWVVSRYIAANRDAFHQILADRNAENNARLKSVPMVDYASSCGYTPVRKGRYYSLAEHDSIIIDPVKNCYWQNSKQGSGHSIGQGGSVIDFGINVCGYTYLQTVEDLQAKYGNPERNLNIASYSSTPSKNHGQNTKTEPDTLHLPEKDTHMKNVFAYLVNTRAIYPEVVQDFVNRKMLYQDIRKNCVFVSYDREITDKPVYACLRGSNTYKKFVGDVEGCDYGKGFYIDNHSERLIVTESVIDAMSVMSILHSQGTDFHAYDYYVSAGTWKNMALMNYLQNQDYKCVYLGHDNDEAGKKAVQVIKTEASDLQIKSKITDHTPPEEWGKDWNEALQKVSRQLRIKELDFLSGRNEWTNLKEAAYVHPDGYFRIQLTADGSWDYSLYNSKLICRDGGQIDDPTLNMTDIVDYLTYQHDFKVPIRRVNLDQFDAKADAVNYKHMMSQKSSVLKQLQRQSLQHSSLNQTTVRGIDR